MSKRNMLLGLVLLFIAAIVAAVAWDRQQTRKLHDVTLARIDTATRALRDAAVATPAGSSAVAAGAERIDRELTALRDTATGRIQLLAAGADGYLLTVRELLRRQVKMLELRTKIDAGIAAFRAHMADRSSADWTGQAVQLKNSLEQDYREFQRTLDAHGKIADSLPEARKALETLAPGDLLVTPAEIKSLRENTLSAATMLSKEISAVRQLAAPR
jgi:hypothetical protein